ncbi:cytochrome c family protein [Aquicoccus sp. G2-2]|uniref:c-type cytochrome n=1 Tax=Aquicoccus sp. G2-2 TaxID=3092120 RepID=UPI002ADF7D34|nr:cytochrome c family protein [Aquicoccus sp. G2-2]MEA1114924.1 cytochrome c family protein [Aquicoccus sp. G2-2]
MFDTMTTTKVIGAFCGALLVFLLGHWASTLIYNIEPAHHGDEEAQASYVIEVEEVDTSKKADEGPTFEELLANADIKKGAKIAQKCKACHKFEDGVNATGPSLYGVVGREVDTEAGYTKYTGALLKVADVWTPENLNHFLTNPKKFAPGTAMGFAGLKKTEDRADLIAYLKSIPEG